MLKESNEIGGSTHQPMLTGRNAGSNLTLPSPGEVFARIKKSEEVVTNYETYVSYDIETMANRACYPSNVCIVKRRYREFDWLHNRLKQKYIVIFVPPLPGKHLMPQLSRSPEDMAKRRFSGLQSFLLKSASHPVLSADVDFVAFLTLPTSLFQPYMAAYPMENRLLSLIGLSPQAANPPPSLSATCSPATLSPADPRPPTPPQSNPAVVTAEDTAADSLTPEQMRLSSETFLSYDNEAQEYAQFCQRLSSLVERMASQLQTLSYDHAELANALARLRRLSADRGAASEATATVGAAVGGMARASRDLAAALTAGPANAWHEGAAFAEVVRKVLKYRLTFQNDLQSVQQEIQDRESSAIATGSALGLPSVDAATGDASAPAAEGWLSRMASIPWTSAGRARMRNKAKSLDELREESSKLTRELAFTNAKIESEWRRWQTMRAEETAASLAAITGAYVAYWSAVADAWRGAGTLLCDLPERSQRKPLTKPQTSPDDVVALVESFEAQAYLGEEARSNPGDSDQSAGSAPPVEPSTARLDSKVENTQPPSAAELTLTTPSALENELEKKAPAGLEPVELLPKSKEDGASGTKLGSSEERWEVVDLESPNSKNQ